MVSLLLKCAHTVAATSQRALMQITFGMSIESVHVEKLAARLAPRFWAV
jgi:hypothetical protein